MTCFPKALVCVILSPILRFLQSVTPAGDPKRTSGKFLVFYRFHHAAPPSSTFGAQVGVVGEDRKFRILSEQEVKDFLDEAN